MLAGAIIALAMVRRGHSPVLWWILIPCGPLLVLLALNARDEEAAFEPTVVHEGTPGSGPLRVLIGIDGNDGAIRASQAAVDELGPLMGMTTIVAVLDYDIGQVQDVALRIQQAKHWLSTAARALSSAGGPDPTAVVLVGNVIHEIARWAGSNDVDLIVLSSHSHPLAQRLAAGSVTSGVLADPPCPVLVVPPTSAPISSNVEA